MNVPASGRLWLLVLACASALFTTGALATQGMKFDCMPKAGTVLRFEGVTIVDYTDGTEVPPGVDIGNPIRFRCKTPAGVIRVSVAMRPPGRGECGLDPGGDMTLSINGVQVMRRVPVNNSCFTSAKTGELTLVNAGEGRWHLRLCGPVRRTTREAPTDKCIERGLVPSKEQPVFDLESFEAEMMRP